MRVTLPIETQCIKGGNSFPLFFDLSESLPAEDLKIQVTKTGAGSGITAEKGEILITRTAPRGSITFKCDASASLTTFSVKLKQGGSTSKVFQVDTDTLSINPLNPQTGTQTSKVTAV